MKNKGFTLVELLAMLVVLGILMGITIPNITGILSNQRIGTIRNDAVTMVETAKIKVAKDELIKKPTKNGECIVFSLNYLNDNDNIETGPNGGKYDEYESFVVYRRIKNYTENRYDYYVRIVEDNDGSYYGIEFDKLENINENKTDNIKKFSKLVGLSEGSDEASSIATLKGYASVRNVCTGGITRYYTTKKYTCQLYQGTYYDANGNIAKSKEKCEESCGVGGCSSY